MTSSNIIEIIPPDLAEAADYIAASWRDGILSLIETGRRLIEVRDRYIDQPGMWSRLIGANEWTGMGLLPFAKTHVYRLIAIAEDAKLFPHVGILPSDSYTLFQLTRISDDRFQELISDGRIHPEMTRSEASDEVREKRQDEPMPDGCTVADLGALVQAGRKFSVIYADPPWEFKVYSGKGKQRSADRHYNTRSLDVIKSLPVESLAADNCALLLWAVCPELPGALDVISSWGFEYKTVGFSWIKQNPSGYGLKWGMGYWTRANMEMCLLATRGSPKRLAKDVHQVVMKPVAAHSRKPDEVQKRIERLLPGPYLELYGRRASPGWTVWGDQITRSLFHQHIKEFAA